MNSFQNHTQLCYAIFQTALKIYMQQLMAKNSQDNFIKEQDGLAQLHISVYYKT